MSFDKYIRDVERTKLWTFSLVINATLKHETNLSDSSINDKCIVMKFQNNKCLNWWKHSDFQSVFFLDIFADIMCHHYFFIICQILIASRTGQIYEMKIDVVAQFFVCNRDWIGSIYLLEDKRHWISFITMDMFDSL